jgi:hypothetical protein
MECFTCSQSDDRDPQLVRQIFGLTAHLMSKAPFWALRCTKGNRHLGGELDGRIRARCCSSEKASTPSKFTLSKPRSHARTAGRRTPATALAIALMTPERPGRSESSRLTAINASIWSVKALELPD